MDFAQQDKDGNNFQPPQNHDKRQDIFYKRRKSGKTTGRSGCLGQAQAGVGYIARNRAERRNIPRKWVMSDDTLLALVKRNPVRVEEFRSIRGTDQLGERDVDGALMAIKRGASCPHDRLPLMVRGHRQISPELESVTDLMYALIRLVAERSGVATSVIASRDDLADYIEHPEQSRLREGWRFELVGSRLDDLLSGNMGLTVKDGKIELL